MSKMHLDILDYAWQRSKYHLASNKRPMNRAADSTKPSRRVAVIGAGPAGLVMAKELREEGHQVTVFELNSRVGGAFAASYDGTRLTTSQVAVAFSSFSDGSEHTPEMWSAEQYLEYLDNFTDEFKLRPFIHFNTRVKDVTVDKDGLYTIATTSNATKKTFERFHHVAVCSGGNFLPNMPTVPGLDTFNGQVLHSKEYKSPESMRGKRVLLIGLGESGSDISLHISRVADACCISSRHGPGYVIPRHIGGKTTDLDTNRIHHAIPKWLGGSWLMRGKAMIEDYIFERMAHPDDDFEILAEASKYNQERGMPWQRRYGVKNTSFVEAIKKHGALYKGDVERVLEDRVVFKDGSTFECDVILCCTGFKTGFPFLNKISPELASKGNVRQLFKNAYHPELGSRVTWAGLVRPGIGSIPPLAEMQARYFALLVSGKRQLPSPEEMVECIEKDTAKTLALFTEDAPRLKALTDYLPYYEDMAALVGCQPPLKKLFITDPYTWAKVVFGPICSVQYRLAGPGATPEKAKAVLHRVPTMPYPVLAYELFVVCVCKTLSCIGFSSFNTTGV